jgi:hypothetical protein
MSGNIEQTVAAIRKQIEKGESETYLKNKYWDFWEKYPKLFNAAADRSFPLTFLANMLVQLEKLNKNEINLDCADSNVYGELRKEYIDPYFPSDQN